MIGVDEVLKARMVPPFFANPSSAANTPASLVGSLFEPRLLPPNAPSGNTIASNRSLSDRVPTPTSFSVIVVYGTLYVSNTQRVHPSSIGSVVLGR